MNYLKTFLLSYFLLGMGPLSPADAQRPTGSRQIAEESDEAKQTKIAYLGLREMNEVLTPPAERVVAIANARVIDGNGGAPIEQACVVIRGDRIVALGPESEVMIPDHAIRFDADGRSLLPGLIDSHFHSRDSAERPIEYELERGITAFRDPGHPFKFYAWLNNNQKTIPRVFLCGGHLDAAPPAWPDQAVVIDSEQEASAAVDAHVNRGASAIKIYMRVPVDQIAAACRSADRHGVPVTAHLELVRADDAIHAGVDGIEHITSFGTALAEQEDAERFEEVVTANSEARKEWRPRLWRTIRLQNNLRVEQLLKQIVDRKVFVSPTLAIFESRPGEKDATAAEVEAFANMLSFFERCHRAGARIVVGSHTAAPFAARGKAYLREMQLMVESGMSPLEVIKAATKTNSEFFGVADRLGTIEPGKVADLVLVDGKPDDTIDDIDHVTDVMLGGHWVVGEHAKPTGTR